MLKTFFTSLLAGSAFLATAQKIEIGLNAGTVPYQTVPQPIFCIPVSVPVIEHSSGPMISVKGIYSAKWWQAGLSLEKYSYSASQTSPTIAKVNYSTMNPNLFLNGIYRLGKSYVYLGLNAGLTFIDYSQKRDPNEIAEFVYLDEGKFRGWSGGLQVGYTQRIYKHLSANIEVSARYQHSRLVQYKSMDLDHYVYPVSAGLRYEL